MNLLKIILYIIYQFIYKFYYKIKNNFIFYKQLSYKNVINQTILKGDNICSLIYDYPTANINNTINLPYGIYKATSNYGESLCIVFYTSNIIHCHIKNFNQDIYGKKLSIYNIENITYYKNYNKSDRLYETNYFKKMNLKNSNKFNKITENVIKGDNIASTIMDYPTANIVNSINLPYGIYKATSNYGETICYVSSSVFKLIECHIKNFNEDIYNKKLTIDNFKKINIDKSYDILYLFCNLDTNCFNKNYDYIFTNIIIPHNIF